MEDEHVQDALVSRLCRAVIARVACTRQAQQAPMGFFVTSVGSGKGGDLGGIAGADQHCQMLAQAGAGTRPGART